MNWSQPRKTFKSEEKNLNQRVLTTCLNTPPKHTQTGDQFQNELQQKQCPYHFGHPTHICLTCRRSICPRCAVTSCQQHSIHPEQQILDLLTTDLQKLTIEPHIQDLELRLKQSKQRQQYLIQKIQKMLVQIQQNFQHTKFMLHKKKQQIVRYYKDQLQLKFIQQYKRYDEELEEKLNWLRNLTNAELHPKCKSIQELDYLAKVIKKQIPTSSTMVKAEIKISKLIAGKDKIKTHSIWCQEKLENVLYQIENIPYKLRESGLNTSIMNSNKKKRVVTETEDNQKQDDNRINQFNSNNKNSCNGMMIKSGSNSRFQAFRKLER